MLPEVEGPTEKGRQHGSIAEAEGEEGIAKTSLTCKFRRFKGCFGSVIDLSDAVCRQDHDNSAEVRARLCLGTDLNNDLGRVTCFRDCFMPAMLSMFPVPLQPFPRWQIG